MYLISYLDAPYDRTLLSKGMNAEKAPQPIRSEDNLKKDGITFMGEKTVTGVDFKGKKVKIGDKETIKYDKLLLASGCKNFVPPIPGL